MTQKKISQRKKITIVGSGNVGATCAHWMASKQLGDIVLLDVIEGVPQGKALDLLQAGPVEGFDVNVVGTQDYKDTADSDIIVITAGSPRKPGMSRDDLLKINTNIVKSVTEQIVLHSPNSILVIVSNPLDAMVYVAAKVSGFPKNRVFGMAGVLDSARFRTFLAQELQCSVQDVYACVLGGHGDTMVPLPQYSTMAGVPITSLLSKEKIQQIVKRTQQGGAEIVNLLKTGSAYYAPSAAVTEMVTSVIQDQKRILPCCVYVNGEYGINDVYLGVPVKLGSNGVEQIIQLVLQPEDQQCLNKSAQAVHELMKQVETWMV